MTSETEQSKVYRLRRVTLNVRIFEYGSGFRVQYAKVSNSQIDSELLAHHDEFYTNRQAALTAFNTINKVCFMTNKLHWNA